MRTDPRWFLTRGIGWGLVFPLFLRVVGFGRYGLPCAIGVLLVWLLFRYHSIVQRVTPRTDDIERFSVGMTHAMFKPVDFHKPALTAVMNDYLNQANSTGPRSAAYGKPA